MHDRIRAALELKLASVSGIPDIAWENVKYSPTTGQSFVRPTFIPTLRRPAVRGINPQMRYQGIFTVDCYSPEGNGPGNTDALAETIIEAFPATDSIYYSSVTDSLITEAEAFITLENGARLLQDNITHVSIEYTERQQGNLQSPWYSVPVDIGWYSYS